MSARRKQEEAAVFPYVGKFLKFWLPGVRGKSEHTVRSYMGMFKSLNAFMLERYFLRPSQITFDSLSEEALVDYVSWLGSSQGLKPSSVNTRIGALKSFARFIEVERPSEAQFCILVSKLKTRKEQKGGVRYLEIEALEKMFEAASKNSLRDLTMLQTLYASGARESEFLALTASDIRFNRDGTASIDLLGKGNKARTVKVAAPVASVLKMYVRERLGAKGRLFCNRNGGPLSPSGLAYVVEKYANEARGGMPDLVPDRVHPHMFRHSIATHMLRAGVDLESIRVFLGHSSIAATMVYAKSDPAAVGEAVLRAEDRLIKPHVMKISSEEKDDLDRWLAEEYGNAFL